ncbi:hypothetical protein F9U64_11485 [Gracilibacillus oryzae]|uniref:ABC-2 family transporter protein n=1 Tax=Gracilibacillus oryzae TaxID=1672701 RepID=A0A7C8KRT5_9BACI|nr:hypothetical protein [Gracilibacillus oryzae]KAB8134751.1 hypothetical protein F9U64_11485 [Gracilibacillus oryzae]
MWKEPWSIVKNELRLLWKPYVGTVLATMLLGFLASIALDQLTGYLAGQSGAYNTVSADIIFILLTPCLTTIFISSPYLSFRTIKEDPFGKRMALYRILPISTKVLVRSRMFIMLFTLITLSIVFYTTLAIVLSDAFYQVVSLPLYIQFALFWFGFSLAFGSVFVFIEYGTNGKMLYIFSFLYGISIFAFIVLFNLINKSSFVLLILENMQQYSLILLLIIWALGIISYNVWEMLLRKRLNKRDYL